MVCRPYNPPTGVVPPRRVPRRPPPRRFLRCRHAHPPSLSAPHCIERGRSVIVDLLVAGGAAVLALAVARYLRPGAALVVSVVLGVLQLYATTRFTVSFAAIWQLAAWVVVLRHRAGLPRARAVAVLYAALVAVSAIVLVWSPDRTAGITLLAQLLGLGSTACLAAIAARGYERHFRVAAVAFAALVAVWAASTVLFRVLPDVEHAYFVSPLFGGLNGQNLAAHFFTTQRNNVLDKTKSGGLFFVNANAASLFGGASAAVLGARAVQVRGAARALLAGAGVLALAGTIATGSKTAVYLAAAACLAVAVVVAVLWRVPPHRRLALSGAGTALLAGLAVVIVPLLPMPAPPAPAAVATSAAAPSPVSSDPAPAPSSSPSIAATPAAQPGLADQSVDALGTRLQIWRIAASIFQQHPLGMFGYGGWHEQYAPLAAVRGLNPSFPPHDWLIDSWSTVGFVGLGLELALVLAVGTLLARRWGAAARGQRLALVLTGIAFGWVLLHGLADNTGFTGGPRLIPVVGLALGVLLCRSPAPGDPATAGSSPAERTSRRAGPAPASGEDAKGAGHRPPPAATPLLRSPSQVEGWTPEPPKAENPRLAGVTARRAHERR